MEGWAGVRELGWGVGVGVGGGGAGPGIFQNTWELRHPMHLSVTVREFLSSLNRLRNV